MWDIRRAIDELAAQALDERTFLERVTPYLRQSVPFDVGSWLIYDPDVVLPTNAYDIGESMPFELRLQYCANEQLEDDVHKYRELARQAVPVGVQGRPIGRAEPNRSRRFRELLEPRGMHAELRAALVVESACWGSLTLERGRGGSPFSPAEARCVAAIAAPLASGLARASSKRPAAQPLASNQVSVDVPYAPGVLVVDALGAIVSASETAADWLELLRDGSIEPSLSTPVPIVAVATGTRSAGPVRLRARTGHGHWLTLHGALQRQPGLGRIHASCDDRVFVTIERSRSSEVLPLVGRRYGLTPRELTLLGLVLRGLSTRHISEHLRISEYTVQDHLKSIFGKTGFRSRRELAHHLALGLFGGLS